MNYMKRNVFAKNEGLVAPRQLDRLPTPGSDDYQDNYQDMMSNFLSLSPSDKENYVGAAQQYTSKTKETSVASKRKTSNQKTETSRNITSVDEEASYILALSEGRGHARCEVGIAAININTPHLILCQLSDNFWYSGTLTKLNILNASEILVPNTYITANGQSKLIKYIQTMYPTIKLTPIPRRHFNESLGIDLIRKLCAPSHQNVMLQINEKFYTLAAAAALLNYLQFIKLIRFVDSTLKIEYQVKYGTMQIDVETSQRLELLYSLCNEKTPKSSLFGVLNYCVTAIGKRNLRAKILQPMCDITLIRASHSCVRELIEKGEILFNLNGILKQFSRVDKLLNLAVTVAQEDNVKAAEIMINHALLLKSCLESVPKLYEIVAETESSSFRNILKYLEDPRFNYLLDKINSILSNSAGSQGSSQYFQRLYAVKTGINELLDQARKMYSDKVDAISKIVRDLGDANKLSLKMIHTLSRGFNIQMSLLKNKGTAAVPDSFELLSRNSCYAFFTTPEISSLNYEIKEIIDMIQITSNGIVGKLLMEIRKEIDAIYHLTGIITELDIIQSLTTASKIGNYCEPTISESIKVKNGIHPLLEHNIDRTECVPNNVIATPEYNFYLITGPNMGGKSIYIKMIAILQVMFQIGCFIPATSAEFRICDKLFSRIGLGDNIENGASSFVVEMREMEYIVKNITANSLVIIDELCRSTNPEEGKILAWRICEKLITMSGVSNDGNYYKDGSGDAKDETADNESNQKLLNITSPFVFMATHFLELTKLPEQFHSVINLHLSAEQKIINGEIHLNYLHKVESGVTPISRYGLALARNVRFPSDIIPRAEELLSEMITNSTPSNLDIDNVTFNTTRDSVKITQIEKGLYDLSYNILSTLREPGTNANKLMQINTLLAGFANSQSKDFISRITNHSFDEVLNMTVATAMSRLGNKSSNVTELSVEKPSTTAKTSDLSYHSLKRRIADLEAKEYKKLCSIPSEFKQASVSNASVPTQLVPKPMIREIDRQLITGNSFVLYRRSEITKTSLKHNLRPLNHDVVEKKSYHNKTKTLNVATGNYQNNLQYKTNQNLNYKSNLPKNHNLDFMRNKSVQSMFNKFLGESRNSRPQVISNSVTNSYYNDDDDTTQIPEILSLSPAVNPNLEYSIQSSQAISLSSDERHRSFNSESFYNVSDFGESQSANSENSRRGELSYQTDLYLQNMFQNEKKKHSTYKPSKIRDNRIQKETENLAQNTPPNTYEDNNISSFFSKKSKFVTPLSTPTIVSPLASNPASSIPSFRFSNESRKTKPLPTSTITSSSLKAQNISNNFCTPSEAKSRKVTFEMAEPSQGAGNNILSFFSKRPALATSSSATTTTYLENEIALRCSGDKSTPLLTSSLAKSTISNTRSTSINLFENSNRFKMATTYNTNELNRRTNKNPISQELNYLSVLEMSADDDAEIMEQTQLDEYLVLSSNSTQINRNASEIVSSTWIKDTRSMITSSSSKRDGFDFEDDGNSRTPF